MIRSEFAQKKVLFFEKLFIAHQQCNKMIPKFFTGLFIAIATPKNFYIHVVPLQKKTKMRKVREEIK